MITANCKTITEIIMTKNRLEGIGRLNSAWQVISMVDRLGLELWEVLVDVFGGGWVTDQTKLLKDVINGGKINQPFNNQLISKLLLPFFEIR